MSSIPRRSVSFVSSPRPSNIPICLSCQWRTSNPARRLAQPQQKRSITRVHINRIKEAMADWQFRAKAIKKGEKQSMLSLLEERGFVNQIVGTREDLDHLLTERRVGVYAGVDPTAPSLHVGHMVPFMVLGWFYIHGYSSTFLLGATTAKIGDPTDRLTPREQPERSERKAAMANMHIQLKRLGATLETYAGRGGYAREWAWRRDVANNSIWHQKVPVADFLRLLGSATRMGPLLGRDTVKTRLENGTGMSFAEFTYPLLQAWDWWELFKKGTQVQIGGADQFGNILAGVNAVKAMKKIEPVHFESDGTFQGHVGHSFISSQDPAPRVGGNINEPIGFTVPLLTTSAGVKFGKSAGNAIWLDKEMTSTFDLYQFFLRTSDADVERYLKLFTFLSIADIEDIMQEHRLDESRRVAQHKLAFEFVELIHGLAAAQEAEKQHKTLFSKDVSIESLRADASRTEDKEARVPGDWSNSLNKYAQPVSAVNTPSVHLKLPQSLVLGTSFARILWSAGLVGSNSEGHRLIARKGCHVGSKSGRRGKDSQMSDYLSFAPITTTRADETEKYIIDDNLLILRVGKWKMKIITIVSDKEYEEAGLTCPGWKEEENVGRENWKEKQQELVAYRTERNRERLQRQQPGEATFSDRSNE